MLQQASTRLFIPEPSEDLITNEPWSIDIYADGLMDELFADIDRILDANGNFISQTVNVQYIPVQTVKVPQIVLPKTLNQPVQEVPENKKKPLRKAVVDTPKVKPVSKKRQYTQLIWGKLLIVGTTVGLAIIGVIYLIQSEIANPLTYRVTQARIDVPQPQLPKKVDAEAELVNYIQKALAVIDKQPLTQKSIRAGLNMGINPHQTALAVTSNPTIASLPPSPSTNKLPTAPQRPTTIVERILYIPMAPSPMRYSPPLKPLPPVRTTASRPNVVNKVLNTVPKPAKPTRVNILAAAVRPEVKPVVTRTAPVPVKQSTNLLPPLPVVPFRAAPPTLPVAKAPTPTTVIQEHAELPKSVADTPSNTLEGLLELGDKSAALFKIDGVTHRIDVGENIGSSGWTLVEVNNGEAIVRRNGEVRSIFTGQKL